MMLAGKGLTEMQMVLALIALTPEDGEGRKLPLPIALARLDRIAKEALAAGAQGSSATPCR